MTNGAVDNLKEAVVKSLDVCPHILAGPSGDSLCHRTGLRKNTGVLRHSEALLPLLRALKRKRKASTHVLCLLNNSPQ